MATLKETANAYSGGTTKNIAELNSVSTDLHLEIVKGVNSDNEEFSYNVVMVDGEKYRVPNSVLKSLKAILEENPALKTIKVKKTGTGLDTTYTVIPLS
jgi:hypothetical protein